MRIHCECPAQHQPRCNVKAKVVPVWEVMNCFCFKLQARKHAAIAGEAKDNRPSRLCYCGMVLCSGRTSQKKTSVLPKIVDREQSTARNSLSTPLKSEYQVVFVNLRLS